MITCYKCGGKGHIKRNCPEIKKYVAENKSSSAKSANIVEEENSESGDGDMLSVMSSSEQLTDAWILDSACSYHMTPNKDWFDTYRAVDSGSVLMGNDASCKVIGIGNVRIKMFDGVIRTLCDVRYIPELRKNLISLDTLDRIGCNYKSVRGMIEVSKGALMVMKGQKVARNIYKLIRTTVVGGV